MFHRVSYEYDANGNCSKAIYDDGSEECWVYNESNYIFMNGKKIQSKEKK